MRQLTGDLEIDELLERCVSTLESKGAEYTIGSDDRLHNFRTVADSIGLKMPQVWFTYFYKHFSAISSYVKNDCTVKSNEGIDGRIMDCIVYLLLFFKMTREIEESRGAETALPMIDECLLHGERCEYHDELKST